MLFFQFYPFVMLLRKWGRGGTVGVRVDGWGCTISDDCPWVDRVIMADLLEGQGISDLARVL